MILLGGISNGFTLKTRKMNNVIQKEAGRPLSFMEVSKLLGEILVANILITSKQDKLLGHDIIEIENKRLKKVLEEGQLAEDYSRNLLNIKETSANITVDSRYSVFRAENKSLFPTGLTTNIPISGKRGRLTTIILARFQEPLNVDDLILAEYGATVIGMKMLREKAGKMERRSRNKANVQMAINSLSYSELEAIKYIIEELDGKEGSLVASKIVDRVGITHSILADALRKLEIARVILEERKGPILRY